MLIAVPPMALLTHRVTLAVNPVQSILRVLMKNIAMTQEPMEELLLNCLQSILRVSMKNVVMTQDPLHWKNFF